MKLFFKLSKTIDENKNYIKNFPFIKLHASLHFRLLNNYFLLNVLRFFK